MPDETPTEPIPWLRPAVPAGEPPAAPPAWSPSGPPAFGPAEQPPAQPLPAAETPAASAGPPADPAATTGIPAAASPSLGGLPPAPVPATPPGRPMPAPGPPALTPAGTEPSGSGPSGPGTWETRPSESLPGPAGPLPGLAPAPPARPPAPPRHHDRLAAALGNASLLGVGYVLLRRRGLAVLADLITLVLLLLAVGAFRTVWFEIVLGGWWLALIAHGWYLGGGSAPRTGRWRQRVTALCFALPVLLGLAYLRFDAQTIDDALMAARRDGDCAAARAALHRIGFGDALTDAPLTVRADDTRSACRRVTAASVALRRGLRSADTDALAKGFDGLAGVLHELPGHDKVVDRALTAFLAGLPTHDACRTADITDWLRARKRDHTLLDRSATVVPRAAPAALLGCGDSLMSDGKWAPAKKRYRQLLSQYPDDPRTGQARAGITKADKKIELDHIDSLLSGSTANGWPEYCTGPEKYPDATRSRHGTNRVMFFGGDDYTGKLPASWQTDDTTRAALIACVGDEKRGSATRTCPYESHAHPGSPLYVTFYKIALPVQVYELRTGRKVADRTIQIGGSSCPSVLSYTTTEPYYDSDPSSKQSVDPSDSDIRAAFRPLVVH
ncbi:hypothetical protein [Actinocatenispora comari]|uniref:Tetratricopeptide repeat protein n=1 Tax=Actinocatenispora comari TaxID=2807577 RepID=A0A8J4ACP6_9ACTN|nr:hypothetical protein [Actinocatenispora comari]GIL26268.1 hypothetical protein NUM_15220 [Actinocatenispora comari]